jgi:hypothetical protein
MGSITAAVPFNVDDSRYKAGYRFTNNNQEILGADINAVYVETPELLKLHLENTLYPVDPEFPFLTNIEIQDVHPSHYERKDNPNGLSLARVYVLTHPRVNKEESWVKNNVDFVCAAAKKHKYISIKEGMEGNTRDSCFKHACLYGRERSYSKKDLLVYRPRAVKEIAREKEKQKFVDQTQALWVNMKLLDSAVQTGQTKIFNIFPELKIFNSSSGYGPRVTVERLGMIVKFFKRLKKSSLVYDLMPKEEWASVDKECDKLLAFELPKVLLLDSKTVDSLNENKKTAKMLKNVCLSVKKIRVSKKQLKKV